MNIKISFHNMPHSNALESHAREKMNKIEILFKHASADRPISIELFLNAQSSHTQHHTVELNLKSGPLKLSAHDKGSDMYVAIDTTIDKMITQIKKEKAKAGDKKHRVQTEKTAFAN